ncbi:lytic polysaccharide monooxygenase [Streptomyces roseoviridis]|uniref:Lytic polysaccharide monooxygenase n=1 Tax=Streptomyces roseoviridis TaxID=67361 RepID=A0ABV5QIX4_9ACTN
MTARRTSATAGAAALFLSGLALAPTAVAHGSMTDPVSRVAGCFAEGPESPDSAACKAAVAASGTQAFYDWNGVNIGNAAGRHRELIPDGELCSAGNEKYRGLDLARADWPASRMNSGPHTFRYKGTAPHRGSFALYVTKDGYDPSKPLAWSDLEEKPFATATDPRMENGDYVFTGTVPKRSGRHLIYSVWQRSDSPEAFYTCSDVVFGQDTAPTEAPEPSAPSEAPSGTPTAHSTAGHAGHGGHTAPSGAPAAPTANAPTAEVPTATAPVTTAPAPGTPNAPNTQGEELAETGGDAAVPYLAMGGAAVLGIGATVLFATARRRSSR